MTKIDWKRKLTSRKFWMAVIAFVTGLLIQLGQTPESAENIGGLILMAASIVAYAIGEGLADSGTQSNVTNISPEGETQQIAETVTTMKYK